jgi:hypothetical protein
MMKLLLNLIPGEPLSFVKELPYFDELIELEVLLVGALVSMIWSTINYLMQSQLSYVGAKCLATSKVSKRGGKH